MPLSDSTKQTYYFVAFAWNTSLPTPPAPLNYTNWNGVATGTGGNTFTPVPSMEVRPASNTGTFQDNEWKIIMPSDGGGFVDQISSSDPWPPVTVTIREVTFSGTATPNTTVSAGDGPIVYVGTIARTVRNYQGRTKSVMIGCESVKNKLRIPLGLTANDQCVWTFAGYGCKNGFTVAGVVAQTGVIGGISGKQVTISGLLVPSGFTGGNGKYWHRGYVIDNELRIGIRDWSPAAPTIFYLTREPPVGWTGKTVKVFPGCDKSIDTCRARWNNEAFFGGFGRGIPNYNPLLEAHP